MLFRAEGSDSKARGVNTSVYAFEYGAQGAGVHVVRKLVHSKSVSFLYDDMYKSIRYLCSYCSRAIPIAVAFIQSSGARTGS